MVKERARRRAEREADAARRRRRAERRARHTARWRRIRTALTPRRRRVRRIGRRVDRTALAVVIVALGVVVALVFSAVDAWPVRVGALALAAILGPVLFTLFSSRSARR